MSIYHEARGSIILKVVIVILIGILLYVIYQPYQIREQEELYKRESRSRMVNIRTAELAYIERFNRYTASLDTLVNFIKDSMMTSPSQTALFKPLTSGPFVPESLLFAPKSHKPYSLTAVDTTRIMKYYLEDPDNFGAIGSLTDDSRINKASWESQ